jgi:glutathione S-transferase
MIKLCGSAISNYYNKVKLALLEKGLAFEEERVSTGSKDEAVLSCSPLGKVPFIRTPQGPLCESEAILGYLEAIQPDPPLLPADPYAAAKVRELSIFVDLHLELVARELYAQAFFGGTVSEDIKASVRKRLGKNIPAFKRLAKFAPYIAGDTFTLADCAAWPHLPLVGLASRLALGEDLLLAHGVDWKAYAAFIGQRPHAQKVAADRKAAQDQLSRR